ncbi:MAG: 50S ribosomal protein L30 [Deltaproteobacteria bacterium]|nr:50S ribosomal protein L30 [Deltaproteobacteria bacterium]
MASSKLKVTQVKSLISQCEKNRKVAMGLGLNRIGKSVVVENTPAFRGMIKKVIHLVKVEEVNE